MDIPYRRLGRTGEMVSLIGVGGYHLGRQADELEAIRIVRTAVDNGVNFLDNCWDYNGGASEHPQGKAPRGSPAPRSEEHTSVLPSPAYLAFRLFPVKKKKKTRLDIMFHLSRHRH